MYRVMDWCEYLTGLVSIQASVAILLSLGVESPAVGLLALLLGWVPLVFVPLVLVLETYREERVDPEG